MTAISAFSPAAPSATRAGAESEGRIPALDGVRGLAILLVIVHHLFIIEGIWLGNLFGQLATLTGTGVDLFFVLSGFLITGILWDSKDSRHYFRNFYARRTLRIFPLYYAVIIFALLIVPRIPHNALDNLRAPVDEWSYWLYMSNISMAYHGEFRHRVLDVTWSLAIEEQFYLVWPIVVWMLGRRGLMWTCIGLIALAICLRTALVLAGASWVATYVLTPCRMDTLAVGSLIALMARFRGVDRLWKPAAYIAPICLIGLLVIVYQGEEYYLTPIGRSVGPTLIAFIYGSLLVAVLSAGGTSFAARSLSQPWLRLFGTYSYALYLTHVPILTALHLVIVQDLQPHGLVLDGFMGQIGFCIGATAICLAVAWLSWHLFEKHFLALKRYFPSPRPQALPAAEHVWRSVRGPEAGNQIDLGASPKSPMTTSVGVSKTGKRAHS